MDVHLQSNDDPLNGEIDPDSLYCQDPAVLYPGPQQSGHHNKITISHASDLFTVTLAYFLWYLSLGETLVFAY